MSLLSAAQRAVGRLNEAIHGLSPGVPTALRWRLVSLRDDLRAAVDAEERTFADLARSLDYGPVADSGRMPVGEAPHGE